MVAPARFEYVGFVADPELGRVALVGAEPSLVVAADEVLMPCPDGDRARPVIADSTQCAGRTTPRKLANSMASLRGEPLGGVVMYTTGIRSWSGKRIRVRTSWVLPSILIAVVFPVAHGPETIRLRRALISRWLRSVRRRPWWMTSLTVEVCTTMSSEW